MLTKTENSCIFNGIHYVEEEPYDEVIVKTGSDDLPPSEGEGAIPVEAPVATKEVNQHA